jgi:hypothetical protein
MAVTPNFGWPTPNDSDDANQGAAAIRALGDAVDAAVAAVWIPVSGQAYGSFGNSTLAATLNLAYFSPVYFPRPTAVDQIRAQVTTAGAAGAVVRLGIYRQNPATGLPGTLLLDAGTVDATTTGVKTISVSETITGMVWCVVVTQVVTATLRSSTAVNQGYYGGAGDGNLNSNTGPTQSGVTGALPASATATTTATNMPVSQLRVA